jgi:3'(2'), 5'-bisphosphate nucleotidase
MVDNSARALLEIKAEIIFAARLAGACILAFYGRENAVSVKQDGSPLTQADQASHEAIVKSLSGFYFPIVSEEAPEPEAVGDCYWLVDPLDGTKDFLEENHEFTVNIALVKNAKPVMGVIYAPALDELYFGVVGANVWREIKGVRVQCSNFSKSNGLRMAKSRFHDHPDATSFARKNHVSTSEPIGAALKYGRLAMGEIDVYPRFVGTSEWDTAAGQAILTAAGGNLVDVKTGESVSYGKPNRRNGKFLAFRAPYQMSDFSI